MHIKFKIVAILLCLEEIKWSSAGDEQQSTKFQLTLHAEMLDPLSCFLIKGMLRDHVFSEKLHTFACSSGQFLLLWSLVHSAEQLAILPLEFLRLARPDR